jgi:4-amino-4-deoxy-L-arabinose transferase-like glycosyltransferase
MLGMTQSNDVANMMNENLESSPVAHKASNIFLSPNYLGVIGALLLLGLYLLGLHQSFLFDVDEGAFTEATREMLTSGDWGHTTLNGTDRFDKPIGVYWLQAISAAVWGVNEFAFRLPSALSAWIASLALARFAFQQWGVKAAIMAAIISATSLGPWAMARTATADALLGMFFVLIFLDLWRALASDVAGPGRRVALWMALGLLVKGPVAVVLPVGTLGILWMLEGAIRSRMVQLLKDPVSWLILLLVSMPWYLYAYARHGQKFIDGFLLKHNVERFTGSMEGHSGNWAYFALALPLLWLPWSALWMKALVQVRSQWQQPVLKYCWIWFAFVFAFFSLANTKLPHYLLYAGPAVCLILTQSALDAGRKSWALSWALGLLGFALILGLPGYLQQHSDLLKDAYYRKLIETSQSTQMVFILLAIPLLLFSKLLVKKLAHGMFAIQLDVSKGASFTAFAVFHSMVLALVVLPWWSHTLQSPVHALALQLKDDPRVVVQWGVHVPSFATYRQPAAPRREPLPGALALVKTSPPLWPADWDVVATQGPLSVVKSPSTAKVSTPSP